MTRTTSARVAAFMFLLYIATALAAIALFDRASTGTTTEARLVRIAHNAPLVRVVVVLTALTIVEALVLGLSLYALTREDDPDLALLALSFRVVEGVMNTIATVATAALLFVATRAGAHAGDAAAANALASLLLQARCWAGWGAAAIFVVGSVLSALALHALRGVAVPAAR